MPGTRQGAEDSPRRGDVLSDRRGTVTAIDAGISGILGWDPDEVVGRRLGELVHPEDLQRGLAGWDTMLAIPGPAAPLRVRYRRRDGRWVWVECTSYNRLDDPAHTDVRTEMTDVSGDTREAAAVAALRAREQLLAQAAEAMPVGLFHVDSEGRMLFANGCLVDITGIAGAPTLKDQLVAVMDRDRPALVGALQAATGGVQNRVEIGIATPNGQIRFTSLSLRPLRDIDGAVIGITGCLQDITDTVSSRRALESQSLVDPVTGCLSREAVTATLDALVRHHGAPAEGSRSGARGGRGTAVLVVEVAGVAAVVERYGPGARDELLTLAALRIRDSVRASDVVGRLGDELFAVLCGGVPGPTTAVTIGRSILERLCQPAELGSGGTVPVQAAMGIVWTGDADTPASGLIEVADTGVRAAIRSGGGDPVLVELPG